MKKIFIIIITLISLNVYSQSTIRTGANIINDSDTLSLLKNVNDDFEINSSISLIIDADTLKGEALIINDSIATGTYSGVLTNTTYVTNAIAEDRYNNDSVAAYNIANSIMSETDTINYADTALNLRSSFQVYPSNINLSSTPVGAVLFEAGDTMSYDAVLSWDGTRLGINNALSNTFVGYLSGNSNLTTADLNTGIGIRSLEDITTGARNSALGWYSLPHITIGDYNIGIGSQAGLTLTEGDDNIAIGYLSLDNVTTGSDNIAIGNNSLSSEYGLANSFNIAIGNEAGAGTTAGTLTGNVLIGHDAGSAMHNSTNNVAIGFQTMASDREGVSNVAVGYRALDGLNNGISGSYNVAIGSQALRLNESINNVGIGAGAGYNNNQSGSIFIGFNAGYNETDSNKLYIDNSSTASPLIYGDFAKDSLAINGILKVDSFQIGDGDVLTSFDTISINDVVYNDTLLFNTVNWVQFGSDSTAVYDKSWNWIYNLGKP